MCGWNFVFFFRASSHGKTPSADVAQPRVHGQGCLDLLLLTPYTLRSLAAEERTTLSAVSLPQILCVGLHYTQHPDQYSTSLFLCWSGCRCCVWRNANPQHPEQMLFGVTTLCAAKHNLPVLRVGQASNSEPARYSGPVCRYSGPVCPLLGPCLPATRAATRALSVSEADREGPTGSSSVSFPLSASLNAQRCDSLLANIVLTPDNLAMSGKFFSTVREYVCVTLVLCEKPNCSYMRIVYRYEQLQCSY